ncbi:MAG: exodeoxyribonuclease VII large subunit, partial [Solirubrobacteraceae bacterium]
RLALALDAHDPQRTLQRGYALVQTNTGEAVSSAAAARRARDVLLRFADSTVEAQVREDS